MQAIHVLLVDDDQNYFKLTDRMLARADMPFDVEWAADYESGLEVMLRRHHDVYLLDYHLGEQSGIDLMREAIAAGVDAPVILLTGEAQHETDMQALKAGASDYIDKAGLKPETLQRTIRYAMEQARTIKSLRESEDRYRSLIEEAFDGIIISDKSGAIILVNDMLCQMIDQSRERLAAMNVQDVIQPSDEGDSLLSIGEEGRVQEALLRRGVDNLRDVEVSARAISDERLQFIVRDITARKIATRERERHIEQLTILRQVDDELSRILRIDYVLMMAMDAAMRLSGADAGYIGLIENGQVRLEKTIGHYANLKPGEILPETPLIRRIINDMQPRLISDVTQEPDYVTVSSKTRAQMLLPLTSYERLIGILNLETPSTDRFTQETFNFLTLITRRVAVAVENAQLYELAQHQLSQMQDLYDQVSSLEKLKTDMIRIAAHDLRNPISVILGYADLLQQEAADNARMDEYLKMISHAAMRMSKITTDILSLERIENLEIDAAEPLDMTSLVRAAYDEYVPQAQQKEQKTTLHLPDEPLMVRADSVQIHEAIANIMTNAIKYTPEGGNISVWLRSEEACIKFGVDDTGYGIPESQQGNLFKPFARVKDAQIHNIEGTGLGLYLLKSIIERYDGTIIFKSVYQQGSTFGFQLPRYEK